MKFQKLDQKQTPQVAVLVLLVVGVFGWAGYSALSSAAPPKKKATKRPVAANDVRVAEAPKSVIEGSAPGAVGTAAGVAENAVSAGGPVPSPMPGGAPLPSIYSPDPFRSLASPEVKSGRPAATPKPAAARPANNRRMALSKLFGGLPNVGDAFPGLSANGDARPVAPAIPAPPARPELLLTGVIDAEKGGTDMALVIIDDQQRILQVGDVLSNYRVAKIKLDGVLLVSGKDRFFVSLGKKTEAAESKPAEPAATAAPVSAPTLRS